MTGSSWRARFTFDHVVVSSLPDVARYIEIRRM